MKRRELLRLYLVWYNTMPTWMLYQMSPALSRRSAETIGHSAKATDRRNKFVVDDKIELATTTNMKDA